jgi:hypothetical protein
VIKFAAKSKFFGTIFDAVGIISKDVQKDLIFSGIKTNITFYIRKIIK